MIPESLALGVNDFNPYLLLSQQQRRCYRRQNRGNRTKRESEEPLLSTAISAMNLGDLGGAAGFPRPLLS